MDNNGQQWATMDIDNNGQQWITMHDNGQQWTTMDNNGQKWTTMDNNGQKSVVLHASLMPFLLFMCSSAIPLCNVDVSKVFVCNIWGKQTLNKVGTLHCTINADAISCSQVTLTKVQHPT